VQARSGGQQQLNGIGDVPRILKQSTLPVNLRVTRSGSIKAGILARTNNFVV
jgi:hypothetical protein